MDRTSPSPAPKSQPAPHEPNEQPAAADAAMKEYVGYLASWFDLAQLAAARRLRRAGMRTSLLNDM
jgi:hypothetical protein